MSRRINGIVADFVIGKARGGDVDVRRIAIETKPGRRVILNNTSAPHQVAELIRTGEQATIYAGGPFLFLLPSQIFGVRVASGEAFHAPRAIVWIPGALLILLIAVPLAMLPITLLLFPLLVLASIWMILISWSGMGARGRFKRDGRRLEKKQARNGGRS
jgi:hypothetical protein